MKISDYSKRVKTHKTSELLFMTTHIVTALEDLSNTLIRIEENHLGLEAKAAEWAISKSVTREVSKVMRVNSRRPYADIISRILGTSAAICKELEAEISRSKEKIWNGNTLTFKQAAVLDTINALENWIDYTYLSFEVLIADGFGEHLTKADHALLNGTLRYYTNISMEYAKGPAEWTKEFYKVADIVVSDETEAVVETSDKLITRMTSNNIGLHRLNPKFWYDLGRSRYDLGRLESLNRYNEQLNMMINLANTKKNGEEDAVLENQIKVYRDEININRAKQEEIISRYE